MLEVSESWLIRYGIAEEVTVGEHVETARMLSEAKIVFWGCPLNVYKATGPTKLKNISGDGRTYFLIGYLKKRYAKKQVC